MEQVQQSQYQILQTVSASLKLAIAALKWQLDLVATATHGICVVIVWHN